MNGQTTECQENRLKPSMGSEKNNENEYTLSLCVVTCTQSCIQGEQILGWINNFITCS